MAEPLGELDFIYLPSADVARDLAFYTEVLGGELGFAIEAFGARVYELTRPGADEHLAGRRYF